MLGPGMRAVVVMDVTSWRRESFYCLLTVMGPDVFDSCSFRGCEADMSLSVVVVGSWSLCAGWVGVRGEEANVGLRS